ncbi:hypothetical protein ABEB36_006007 [Hypothenemus hampei]|uniref:Large ribosomal subunit protein mL49 n=1 Tax=Hypothenemus hampei TaxID=57062 RepID=A0ABD1F060_HYPHA
MSFINKLLPFTRQFPILTEQLGLIRYSSYKSSYQLEDINPLPRKYEITKDPMEWEYVARLLPPAVIPEPLKKDKYPSGWKPQAENLSDRPYFIQRNKFHELPIYLKINTLKTRRSTVLRNIQGDIWLLEKEIRDFLSPQFFQPIRSQVNEFAGYIRIHGDYVNAVKYFLEQKGY